MRIKLLLSSIIICIFSFVIIFFGCNLANWFKQPTVDVKDYTLTELPTEYTKLDVDVVVTNNDWRNAAVTTVTYKAEIEGVDSKSMTHKLNETLIAGQALDITMPLTLPTEGAALLLKKLGKGQKLDFTITGIFHVDDPCLSTFDLPLNTSGKAKVDVGYEEYFAQPEVEVNSFTVTSVTPGLFTTDIDLSVDITVTNMDTHDATIDEVEYIVNIEGVKSDEEIYNTTFNIAAANLIGDDDEEDLTMTNISLHDVSNITLAAWTLAGHVSYTVTGTFHAETDLGNGPIEFYLPLYVTGDVTFDNPF
ncbi:MAG: hypothetical protein KAT05_10010 [Spirochaetes bacterium]|nr:hypothetical protein [Spirochaetota bacterium]